MTAAGIMLGVDPGSKYVGVVVYDAAASSPDGSLLASDVLVRQGSGVELPDTAWLRTVVAGVKATCVRADVDPDTVPKAIEGLAHYAPTARGRNQLALYGTAAVMGALMVRWSGWLIVAPGGPHANGSAADWTYPSAIRPTAGTSGRSDRARHARSAYDVAAKGRRGHIVRLAEQAARR